MQLNVPFNLQLFLSCIPSSHLRSHNADPSIARRTELHCHMERSNDTNAGCQGCHAQRVEKEDA